MSLLTLEIARNAMAANQAALDVVAHNVANANTPGYVRQRALLAPLVNACTGDRTLPGLGATVVGVQRLRDRCLETQIAHQEGRLGAERALADSLGRLERTFTDLGGNGVAGALTAMFDALQTLQTTPNSLTSRQAVLDRADELCTRLQGVVGEFTGEKQRLDQDLAQTVARTNALLHQVATLNGQLMAAGDSLSANDLRVAREQALRELAGLCGAVGLDQPDGGQDVLIGGVRLVQGTDVHELSLGADPAQADGLRVAVGDLTDLDGLGGRLAGDLRARSEYLPGWSADLDNFARTLAEAVNAAHRQGYDLAGQPGAEFFTFDPAHPAATLKVSASLQADPTLLAASAAPTGLAGDGANAAALAALRDARLAGGGTQTLAEAYESLLYRVGAAQRCADEAASARTTLLESLDTQWGAVSGVSLDEEAVDVMRFQQAYNASARLVQVALAMLDTLLEMAG